MSHTHIYFNDRETYSWLRSTIGKFLRTNSASWLSWNVELPVGTQIALVAPSSFFFWSLIHDGNGKFYIPDENVKQKWQATRINNSSSPHVNRTPWQTAAPQHRIKVYITWSLEKNSETFFFLNVHMNGNIIHFHLIRVFVSMWKNSFIDLSPSKTKPLQLQTKKTLRMQIETWQHSPALEPVKL